MLVDKTSLAHTRYHSQNLASPLHCIDFTAVCKTMDSLNQSMRGKKMRCKHAFRPISAGFAAIQLGIQCLNQLILYSNCTDKSVQPYVRSEAKEYPVSKQIILTNAMKRHNGATKSTLGTKYHCSECSWTALNISARTRMPKIKVITWRLKQTFEK
jgi:hypothetical protein